MSNNLFENIKEKYIFYYERYIKKYIMTSTIEDLSLYVIEKKSTDKDIVSKYKITNTAELIDIILTYDTGELCTVDIISLYGDIMRIDRTTSLDDIDSDRYNAYPYSLILAAKNISSDDNSNIFYKFSKQMMKSFDIYDNRKIYTYDEFINKYKYIPLSKINVMKYINNQYNNKYVINIDIMDAVTMSIDNDVVLSIHGNDHNVLRIDDDKYIVFDGIEEINKHFSILAMGFVGTIILYNKYNLNVDIIYEIMNIDKEVENYTIHYNHHITSIFKNDNIELFKFNDFIIKVENSMQKILNIKYRDIQIFNSFDKYTYDSKLLKLYSDSIKKCLNTISDPTYKDIILYEAEEYDYLMKKTKIIECEKNI